MGYWDNLYWLLGVEPPSLKKPLRGQQQDFIPKEKAWVTLMGEGALKTACLKEVQKAVQKEDDDAPPLEEVLKQLEDKKLPGIVEKMYTNQSYGDFTGKDVLNRLQAAVVASQLALAAKSQNLERLKELSGKLLTLIDSKLTPLPCPEPLWPKTGTDPEKIADAYLKSFLVGEEREHASAVAAARDMVWTLLTGEPRPAVFPGVQVPVLYFESSGTGDVLFLELELLADGTGGLFAEPFRMGLQPTKVDFLESLQQAWEVAPDLTEQDVENQDRQPQVDVRWALKGLKEREEGWPRMIEGPSAGAMAAVTLAQLLAGKPVEETITITAALKENKKLGPVGGVFEKSRAVFEERSRITRIVVHPECASDALEAARSWCPALKHPVVLAKDLKEVMTLVRQHAQEKWPYINLRPPSPPDDFVGRTTIIKKVRNYIEKVEPYDREHSGYFSLFGGMGRGKTALMLELIKQATKKGEQPVYHLIRRDKRTRYPKEITGDLYKRLLYKYRQRLDSLSDEREQQESTRLEKLMERISNTILKCEKKREVIYIDAADEIDDKAKERLIGGILPRPLPEGFRCVISSRHEALSGQDVDHLDLDQEDEKGVKEYRDTIREFLRQDKSPLDPDLVERIVNHEPNPPVFFTLSYQLRRLLQRDDVTTEQPVSAEVRRNLLSNPESWVLPPEELFNMEWKRVADLAETEKKIKSSRFKEILGLHALAAEPLSKEQLQYFGLWNDSMEQVLKLAQSFFVQPKQLKQRDWRAPGDPYEFWHGGFRELILDGLSGPDEQACHQQLAEGCLGWQKLEGKTRKYALAHLPGHLISSKQWEELEKLLCGSESLHFLEAGFLEAKVEAGMVSDLADDYRQAAKKVPKTKSPKIAYFAPLLEEALRRDLHFLERQPAALFQCLWNSCWWYDSPDAEKHYVEPSGGWNQDNAPWLSPTDPKLCGLLKAWREWKKEKQPGFRWLRSLRPPTVALGGALKAIFRGHEGTVNSVAFSPDGKKIVSGDGNAGDRPGDGTVKVWDADTGEELLTIEDHSGSVNSVAFSPDGQRIASGSWDNTVKVKVWDANTGQELLTIEGHSDSVDSVAFSPDGKRIVSGSDDKTVRVWDSETGEELLTIEGHSDSVNSVAFSPGGKRIVSGDADGTVKVWDADTGEELPTIAGHYDCVLSVAFSPDGKRVASGSWDKTVRVWDTETSEELRTLEGHTDWVCSVAFSRDGQRIVSGSCDSTVKVWDADTGEELRTLEGHFGSVHSVAFSPDGKRIVSAGFDGTLRVWDCATDQQTPTLKGHFNWVCSVAFSPDGRWIVSGSVDKKVKVWDADTGEELRTLEGHSDSVTIVAFSLDGKRIVSGDAEGTVKVWDADTGQELRTLKSHTPPFRSVAFSPDGQRIVSGCRKGTVKVWDTETSEEPLTLAGHRDYVFSVAFSPDGKRIVSGSTDETVKVWDAETGTEKRILKGHSDLFGSVAFSPDGQRIVSGWYDDKTVRHWDVDNGECVKVLEGWNENSALALNLERFAMDSVENTVHWDEFGRGHYLGKFTTDSSGRIWAGSEGPYVYILRLKTD